jgi:hypothetical protein
LFAKPSPLNINLSSDRFSMFNKERDIFLGIRHTNSCRNISSSDVSSGSRSLPASGLGLAAVGCGNFGLGAKAYE